MLQYILNLMGYVLLGSGLVFLVSFRYNRTTRFNLDSLILLAFIGQMSCPQKLNEKKV